MKLFPRLVLFLVVLSFGLTGKAQVSYGPAAAYGLRKVVPGYSGQAIQVRRSCDNGVRDIGFNTCGDLDTIALKTFVVAANPLSAITVTSATAFSLRRLSCTYAGAAIRVRSSAAGSPTTDIGFTANGDLDTAALKTFIGSNSGFVTIWYDQSGNSRHASQSTTGSQPRIVNAGVIDRQGTMPAIRWLGAGYSLATPSFSSYATAACFNGVARVNSNLTYNTIHNKTNANYPAPLDLYNNQMVVGDGSNSGYSFFGYGQTFNASLPLSIWTYQAAAGGSYNFYYNAAQTASGTVGQYGDAGNPLVLGSRADGVTGLNGWISESITFPVIPSATDRQFLEWSQAQYYGISGPVLSSLPASPASGFVSAWYDQSGTGKNAVQTTTANQGRIINAGILDKNGLLPAIHFGGFPQNLIAPLSTSVYPVSLSLLANTSGTSSGGAFIKLGTDVNAGAGGIAIGIGSSGGNFDVSGNSLIGLKEWVTWSPSNPNVTFPSTPFISTTIQQSGGGGMTTHLNGTSVPLSNAANAVGASISGSLFIGGYTNSANRFPFVKQSEVIVFPAALSTTRRVLLETNQAAYNGTSLSNNKYIPPTPTSYQRFVNGVGRESSTDSVAGTRSTVGMGISIGTSGSDFLKDNGDYLTYGINCPVSATVSTANLPAGVVQRWFNDWYLNKTDVGTNHGTITFFFDFSDYGLSILPGTAGNYELLVRNTSSGTFSIVTGTTKSVVGDRVRFSVDASTIPTNAYYTIGTQNIPVSPLPVEMTAFNLSCENKKVRVTWSTATESRNDHFSIERSQDGFAVEKIGLVRGAGTTQLRQDYSYTDDRPFPGVSYYRIVQSDTDGEETAFLFASIQCAGSEEGIVIYPNPTTGSFVIEGAKLYSDISIYDRFGRLVFEQKNVLAKEIIDVSPLTDGVYVVKVTSGQSQTSLKLILQH